MSYCDHFPSVVRPFTRLNDFSFETPFAKFLQTYVKLSVKGRMTNCTNGHDPFIKMAAVPVYGKTLKIFFSRSKEALGLNLGIKYRRLEISNNFVQMMIVG